MVVIAVGRPVLGLSSVFCGEILEFAQNSDGLDCPTDVTAAPTRRWRQAMAWPGWSGAAAVEVAQGFLSSKELVGLDQDLVDFGKADIGTATAERAVEQTGSLPGGSTLRARRAPAGTVLARPAM